MRSWRSLLLVVLLVPATLFGQATSGSLTGKVTTSEGQPLPGVTVTITSPSMQGSKTDTTSEGGGYLFPSLPPGEYTVSFELEGMQPIKRRATVNVAQASRSDAELKVSAVSEAITVTAATPVALETTEVSANFKMDQINALPMERSINAITLLSPGVTEAGPNNQITISGSHSYDNLFLLDGVVVNENLRGQPNPVYIEDAIQETTVLTGGVSAEFGRFTGGVVSTVTKSGGNDFKGSLRDNVSNPDWTKKTEFVGQADPLDQMNHTYEGTFGGRFIRDRLWFFAAGRYQKRDERRATTWTAVPYMFANTDRRYEGKLTTQLTPEHSLVGSYTKERDLSDNTISSGRVVDVRSLTPFDRPRSLLALTYNGVVARNFLLEGHFSRMRDRFTNGAENRDLIEGTLLLDAASGNRMWSPTFCGSPCPPKQRNNKEWIAKGSYFLSTRATGDHSIVGGIDEFHQLRDENNYQSGSDLRIHGTFLCNKGGLAVACSTLTASELIGQTIYFGTNTSNSEIEYDPVPALSHTSDFAVRSFFVNDKWQFNDRWDFNVGVRYDKAFGKDQAGNRTVDDSAISPRLAAIFDPRGDGRHRFSATYGRYVSKVDQGPADNTATAGRYASYYWDYKGPVINAPGTPITQLVATPDVIQQVFNWFNSVGGTKNTALLTSVRIPGVTTRFDRSLSAPYMDEWTVGYGIAFGTSGYLRADFVSRKWGDFYVLRRTIDTGKARDPNGNLFDQGVIENSDDSLSRKYNGIQMQGNYRLMQGLTVGGNYTYARLRGNVEGETAGFATSITDYQNRPEYTWFPENNAEGWLGPDMRHRGNVWLQYDLTTRAGRFNLSLLERYHSALSYSALSTIDVRVSAATGTGPTNGVVNPGYTTVPASVNYYFGERGDYKAEAMKATDLGVNWYIRAFGPVSPFIEIDLINAFNSQAIEDPDFIDKTVLTRRNTTCIQPGTTTRCLAFNPLKDEKPTEGVHWVKGVNFGKPTSALAYQQPRTYRFSFGLRF
jgi:Carboxypeptidase regulatory-like domain/TonB dependent receptor/TonB-dependent Receptor Plug Domain